MRLSKSNNQLLANANKYLCNFTEFFISLLIGWIWIIVIIIIIIGFIVINTAVVTIISIIIISIVVSPSEIIYTGIDKIRQIVNSGRHCGTEYTVKSISQWIVEQA